MIKIKLAKKKHPEYDAARANMLLDILEHGSTEWNRWRAVNPHEYIDLRQVTLFGKDVSFRGVNLSEANLSEANLAKVDLRDADLSAAYAMGTNFQGTHLQNANMQGAYLYQCDFSLAYLTKADLRLTELSESFLLLTDCNGANLRKAKLHSVQVIDSSFIEAILVQADLSDAILRRSDFSAAKMMESCLNGVSFVEINLQGANLTGSHVFGTSVWKSNLQDAQQANLIITPDDEPDITVDNLKIAQFIYLILNNDEIRDVIDTITSKVVLIIGRFTPERKVVLDAIRQELRNRNYTPIMFDFTRPVSKNFIETVNTLAGMSRFVIADLTDTKVVLQELESIVKGFPSVPVRPLLLRGSEPTAVLLDFADYPTFMEVHQYSNCEELILSINESVISPAEAKAEEIRERRRKMEKMISDFRTNGK